MGIETYPNRQTDEPMKDTRVGDTIYVRGKIEAFRTGFRKKEVPVILCKDCRYFEEVNPVSGLTRCRKWKAYNMTTGSGFCSLAERRTARDDD